MNNERPIINANNGAILHDHPFFKQPNDADAGRAALQKVEAERLRASRLRHEVQRRLDPAHVERSHA